MFSVAFTLALLAAPAETAVVAAGVSPQEAQASVGCGARFACASSQDTAAALADATSLGVLCAPRDGACWQRFMAVSGFARVVAVDVTADETVVVVAEPRGTPATGSATREEGTALAVARAFGEAPPRVERTPDVPPPAAEPTIAPWVPWTVVGVGALVAVGTGAAAALVSADLNRSLEDAKARRAPLEDYDARNALFFACAGASAAGAITAGVGLALVATE